jgi:O-antigen ligase
VKVLLARLGLEDHSALTGGLILIAAVTAVASVYFPTWLLFSVIGAIVLGTVFLNRLDYLIYLMLFLAPFHFLVTRVLLNVPSLSGDTLSLGGLYQDIWPLILVMLWSIRGAISGSLRIKKSPVVWPITLLIGWALLHLISTAPLTPALFGLRNLARYAILPFLLPIVIGTKKQVNRVFLAAFWGMSLAAIVSMADVPAFLRSVAQARSSLGFDVAGLSGNIRFVGIFGTEQASTSQFSNVFAIALALMVTYGVAMLVSTKKGPFYLVGIFAQVIPILLTFSRRGYLTLLLGPVLLFWWWKKPRLSRVQLVLAASIILLISVGILLTTSTGRLIASRFVDRPLKNTSMSARRNDWRFLWSEVTQDPFRFVWGYGLASTGPVSERFSLPQANPAHNYYLMILHEMGIVGLGLFSWVLWRVVKLGQRIIKQTRDKDIERNALFCLVVVVLLILNGLLGTTFEGYPLDLFFWTVIGILIAIKPVTKSGESLSAESVTIQSDCL